MVTVDIQLNYWHTVKQRRRFPIET